MAGENLRLGRTFDFVILSETLNFAADVQKVLGDLANRIDSLSWWADEIMAKF